MEDRGADDEPGADGDDAPVPEFPLVGIGASAGGLDALEHFFSAVAPDCGMAFAVVTHSQPGRPSLLPQLLGRHTTLPIAMVERPTTIERNTIYIAPAGSYLEVHDGELHPVQPPDSGHRGMSIDFFFRSLAAARGRYAIGVVLSGTGSDGTLGVREIKGASGLALAQEESSARYPSMPHSAAATQLVDYVLPPRDMPERLDQYVRHAFRRGAPPFGDGDREGGEGDDLQRIFQLLRRHSGHDFSEYKPSTLRRRIERRMNVQRIAAAGDYARYLQANPGEIDALFHELLIGVTSFFRDADAFAVLEAALPSVIEGRRDRDFVRVWLPGCSTGEEAYTIAILLRECMERLDHQHTVQIFATDLDATAIDVARAGVYPDSIAAFLTPERLQRFFTQVEGGYRIRKDLREMIVFAPHDVTSDPPFTRIDLVSCRNLLIYLNSDLQARLLPLFHYALRRGGLLFLGSAETVGGYAHLFDVIDRKWKLFARREVPGAPYPGELVRPVTDSATRIGDRARAKVAETSLANVADRLLFHHLVPPSLLVHETGDIVHIHGRTGELLEPSTGLVGNPNVLAMAREGLALDLAAALREASLVSDEVVRRAVRVKSNGHHVFVDLRVRRITEPEPFRGLLLVSFERIRLESADGDPTAPRAEGRLLELQHELAHAEEIHRSVTEELEAANEELKSTNEELQSTNEELQSTNEELETSKEEMQSLNEELQTVNAELQDKLDELSRTTDDMANLLNSTDIATVFLDHELRIKRYTEQARKVIPLIPADVGRPIGDLVSRLRYERFVDDARRVLRTLTLEEAEVQSEDGKWYLARILPYRTTENVIDGLVITFVEVTRVKGLQEQSGAVIAALARSPTMLFGQDAALRYTWAVTPVFGVAAADVIGRTNADLLSSGAAHTFDELERRVLASARPARERVTLEVMGARRTYDLYLEPLRDGGGAMIAISGVMTELG